MKFTELAVSGAYKVELEPWTDERGFFARAWCATELSDHGLDGRIEQMNLSTNHRRGMASLPTGGVKETANRPCATLTLASPRTGR